MNDTQNSDVNASQERSKEKFKIIDELLTQEHVLVHINTRSEGVVIPAHLTKQNTVTLKLSRMFRRPVEITEAEITADLLFNGSYFQCVIPWAGIWGATSAEGEGRVWPDDIPEDLVAEILAPTAKSPQHSPPHLAVAQTTEETVGKVKSSKAPALTQTNAATSSSPTSPKPRGHLKLVK